MCLPIYMYRGTPLVVSCGLALSLLSNVSLRHHSAPLPRRTVKCKHSVVSPLGNKSFTACGNLIPQTVRPKGYVDDSG